MAACDEGEGTVSDEVAGEEDQIRREDVDLMDDALEKKGLRVLVEVNVTELNDAIAAQRGWEIGDGDGAVHDVNLMARNLTGVEG